MAKPEKPLSLKKAVTFMRNKGAVLLNQGGTYYVIPGGRVEDATAEAIQKRPDVNASKDWLWPGYDETWRLS